MVGFKVDGMAAEKFSLGSFIQRIGYDLYCNKKGRVEIYFRIFRISARLRKT